LKSLASLNTNEDAIQYLNDNQWDLEKAVEAVFTAKGNADASPVAEVSIDLDVNGYSVEDIYRQPDEKGISNKALILLVLPDNRTHTCNLEASDTFWGLYGQALRAFPELSRKNITFVLPDGHKLQENEYNQSLESCGCAPEGSVKIIFT